jgi:hypothetical protein
MLSSLILPSLIVAGNKLSDRRRRFACCAAGQTCLPLKTLFSVLGQYCQNYCVRISFWMNRLTNTSRDDSTLVRMRIFSLRFLFGVSRPWAHIVKRGFLGEDVHFRCGVSCIDHSERYPEYHQVSAASVNTW